MKKILFITQMYCAIVCAYFIFAFIFNIWNYSFFNL